MIGVKYIGGLQNNSMVWVETPFALKFKTTFLGLTSTIIFWLSLPRPSLVGWKKGQFYMKSRYETASFYKNLTVDHESYESNVQFFSLYNKEGSN